MKAKAMTLISLWIGLSTVNMAGADESVSVQKPLYSEYPHAIVCQGETRGHKYDIVYYQTNISHTEYVRYDSGSTGYLLHFNGGTGTMAVPHSTPAWVDCVSQGMSISDLIKKEKALTMFSVIPSGAKFSQ